MMGKGQQATALVCQFVIFLDCFPRLLPSGTGFIAMTQKTTSYFQLIFNLPFSLCPASQLPNFSTSSFLIAVKTFHVKQFVKLKNILIFQLLYA